MLHGDNNSNSRTLAARLAVCLGAIAGITLLGLPDMGFAQAAYPNAVTGASPETSLRYITGPGSNPGVFVPGTLGPVGAALGLAGNSVPGSPGPPSGAGRSGITEPATIPQITHYGPSEAPWPFIEVWPKEPSVAPPPPTPAIPTPAAPTPPREYPRKYRTESPYRYLEPGAALGIVPNGKASLNDQLQSARATAMKLQLGLAAIARDLSGPAKEHIQRMVADASLLSGDLRNRGDESALAFHDRIDRARTQAAAIVNRLYTVNRMVAPEVQERIGVVLDHLDELDGQLDRIDMTVRMGDFADRSPEKTPRLAEADRSHATPATKTNDTRSAGRRTIPNGTAR